MPRHQKPADSNDYEMNAHLGEKFGRRRTAHRTSTNEASDHVTRPKTILDTSIRRYFKEDRCRNASDSWKSLPEFPTIDEIFELPQAASSELALDTNIVVGPYASKEDYLSTLFEDCVDPNGLQNRHYSLLREDAVGPLRDVVSEVQQNPHLLENSSRNNAYIYEKVYITGITFASSGIAARLAFSLGRVQRGVNWAQSKRLRSGTLIALTPANAVFKASAYVGVVAARRPILLQEDPPKVDVFFADVGSIQLDPQQEFLMVESRNGFFEGHRHVMTGLQALSKEKFPLSEHIVELQRDVSAPDYVLNKPIIEAAGISPSAEGNRRFDVTKGLPWDMPSSLDETQLEALERALSKRLGLIQGPPGTGKTYVSVVALNILLQNSTADDPPIIIASHTNHAIDQLLRHVSAFEQDFIRLGAMSTDTEIIKPRTLFEIKSASRPSDPQGCLRTPAMKEMRQLTKEMKLLLEPLTQPDRLPPIGVFEKYKVLTSEQCQSLVKGAQAWYSQAQCEIDAWLGDEKAQVRLRNQPDGYELDPDDIELAPKEVKELEAEGKTLDLEDRDALHGEFVDLCETWTGKSMIGMSDAKVQQELTVRDLYDIRPRMRGPVYRVLQSKLKDAIQSRFCQKATRYMALARDARIGRWEVDFNVLRGTRVLGMTTSGLAKNRALLQALKPKIVLMEEAAETLESYVSVACFGSLEHLILVGDHQQLRGHCHVDELAMAPFWLGISIFERLLRNSVEYTRLGCQRRMIPEIRRLIAPSYPNLRDHSSMTSRGVLGMDVATFFFAHAAVESNDSNMSKCNEIEADLVVAFTGYLVQNGLEQSSVAILTFYNGQRRLLQKNMRKVGFPKIHVYTIDSYQGEESEVVILSCVRSNSSFNIGFLEVENRVVVSLSRAKQGFYAFGNATALCKSSSLWWRIIQVMASNPTRVGFFLPLRCLNHGNTTFVQEAEEFAILKGGCRLPCGQYLDCGHECPFLCHPFTHDQVRCSYGCEQAWTARMEGRRVDDGDLSKSQQQIADHRRVLLDQENAARLFGNVGRATQQIEDMTLTRIRKDGEGGRRGVWTGKFRPSTSQSPANPEKSLLD